MPSCFIGDQVNVGGDQLGWKGGSRSIDPPSVPNGPTPEPTSNNGNLESQDDGLSTGWIIIIVFFSALIMYCIIGFVYNGKKRDEYIIPNYAMWKLLPKLTMAGCNVSYEFVRGLMNKGGDYNTDDGIEQTSLDNSE